MGTFFCLNPSAVCHPFVDIEDPDHTWSTMHLSFYTDASKNPIFGLGTIFGSKWCFAQWEQNYIARFNPSIVYLELYALCVGILFGKRN